MKISEIAELIATYNREATEIDQNILDDLGIDEYENSIYIANPDPDNLSGWQYITLTLPKIVELGDNECDEYDYTDGCIEYWSGDSDRNAIEVQIGRGDVNFIQECLAFEAKLLLEQATDR